MKLIPVVALLAALGCAGVAAIWWWGNSQLAPQNARAAESGEGTQTDEGRTSLVDSPEARPEIATRGSETETQGVASTVEATEYRSGSNIGMASPRVDPAVSWPVSGAGRTGSSGSAPTGEPVVAVELAFRALQYVGIDPEAEKAWLRVINDPNTSPVDRGDLIEDLNEEGYLDNSHPTKEDLPLILARLELIERVAPYAVDKVNADAFEEAYKDLLNMYIRLGGEPRDKR